MVRPTLSVVLRAALASVDPRQSLGAAAMWLIAAMAVSFSIAAAIWVGSIARANVLEQHVRRLSLETDQLSAELSQAIGARLDAVRGASALSRVNGDDSAGLRTVFGELAAAYPHIDWIAAADPQGVVVAASSTLRIGDDARSSNWFLSGLQGPWLGVIEGAQPHSNDSPDEMVELGDLVLPVHNKHGHSAGVIAVHVGWQRAAHHPDRLTDEPDPRINTEVCVLDRTGLVLVGPKGLLGRPWPGTADPGWSGGKQSGSPQFELLPDGRRVLVSRSLLAGSDEIAALGWRVQLSEPNERVFQRANALVRQILWASLSLGMATALLGIIGARQLTRRLKRLAISVTSVGQDAASRIEVPRGTDEVARLGQAFAKLLEELAQERRELERRVAVRTLEVERLADESRYSAIVRERLQIARDLHDTLAHSMMAILSEIRFLRKLQIHDPQALTKELARAETIAQDGLREARSAITKVRVTAVRETGLGPALAGVFEHFLNLTGLSGEFHADVAAARFGDERAETIVRMAREALRNVERHASASRVTMRLETPDETSLELRIEDNGVGFDPQEVPAGHYGIVGLREQADLIGATLDIQSTPGKGTTLRVVLRLSPVVFKPLEGSPRR